MYKIHDYNSQEHMHCCIDKAYKMLTATIYSLYEDVEDDCTLNAQEVEMLKNVIKALAYLQPLAQEAKDEQQHHNH